MNANQEVETIAEVKGTKAANLLTWSSQYPVGGRNSAQDKLTESFPKVKEDNGLLARAQQNIAKVAERKAKEAKKLQDEKEKKLRIAAAARAAVKSMKPADYVRPKPSVSSAKVEPQPPVISSYKPVKQMSQEEEEKVLSRLAQSKPPPPPADMDAFRRRNRLSEK